LKKKIKKLILFKNAFEKKKTGEDLHPHQKCVFLKTKRADIVNLLKKPEKNKL
jgi:hypothetical protein